MSRYDELTADERAYVRRAVAEAPPLNTRQTSILRVAFADTHLTGGRTG